MLCSQAKADYWGSVIKVDCVEELNYFSIRNLQMDLADQEALFEDRREIWDKYKIVSENLGEPIKYECKLPEVDIRLVLDIRDRPASCSGTRKVRGFLKVWLSKDKFDEQLFYDGPIIDECHDSIYVSEISYHSHQVYVNGFAESFDRYDSNLECRSYWAKVSDAFNVHYILKAKSKAKLPLTEDWMQEKAIKENCTIKD